MNRPLRIVFAGTPEFAAAHLRGVLASAHTVVGVYTQPDRPAGRGRKLVPGPVKQVALAENIPVYQPTSLRNDEQVRSLQELRPDVVIVVAYGLLLPQAILDVPTYGCLNVHGSLLPRWRGAAPIQRATEAGDAKTGVTIMQMDKGLDTGAMLLKKSCPIAIHDSSATLYNTLAKLGAEALQEVLDDIVHDRLQPQQQDEQFATYAHKITKPEGQLDWSCSAEQLDRKIRAFNPSPVTWMSHPRLAPAARIRVWQAAALSDLPTATPGTVVQASRQGIDIGCAAGVLRLLRLQLPGGRALSVGELLNSRHDLFVAGEVL